MKKKLVASSIKGGPLENSLNNIKISEINNAIKTLDQLQKKPIITNPPAVVTNSTPLIKSSTVSSPLKITQSPLKIAQSPSAKTPPKLPPAPKDKIPPASPEQIGELLTTFAEKGGKL